MTAAVKTHIEWKTLPNVLRNALQKMTTTTSRVRNHDSLDVISAGTASTLYPFGVPLADARMYPLQYLLATYVDNLIF